MKKTITVESKRVEDAIREGLSQLGVSMGEAEVKIISQGGLFKKAKVEISVVTDDQPAVTAAQPAPPVREKSGPDATAPAKPASAPAPATEKSKPAPLQERPKAPAPATAGRGPGSAADKTAANAGRGFSPAEKSAPFKASAPNVKPAAAEGAPDEEKRHFRRREETHEPATPETAAKAEAFLKRALELANIPGEIKSDLSDGLSITLETQDSLIIGHRGETLDALQYLTSLMVNTEQNKFTRVTLDALGYRARRAESLRRLAAKMAEKCVRQNRRVSLEAMNNSDRKEIHAFLSELGGVVTKSEGYEPNRRIVIYPKK